MRCSPFYRRRFATHTREAMKAFWEVVLISRKLGIDPTEACASIGLLMELYHEGIISEKDTDGIPIERGGREVILETIRKIGYREGYGDLLAEGQRAFAQQIGPAAVEKLDLVKGLAPTPMNPALTGGRP